MPATTNLVPIVGGIHFDDLLNEFEVHASLELKTPAGNFRKEFRSSASDLAAAILWLVDLWTGQSMSTGADKMGYPVGDLAALGAALTSGPLLAEDVAVLPEPPDPATGPDVPFEAWDGNAPAGETWDEDWGGTHP